MEGHLLVSGHDLLSRAATHTRSEGFSHCPPLWQGLKPKLSATLTARLEAVP
jgi:hypothetical protein